jgi:hypothetical protein
MPEKSLEELEEENLSTEQELSILEKKARINQLKQAYGSTDYKRVIGKGLKNILGGKPASPLKGQ